LNQDVMKFQVECNLKVQYTWRSCSFIADKLYCYNANANYILFYIQSTEIEITFFLFH